MVDIDRVDGALQRSQDHLLRLQSPAGFWLGELEADSTITSEYLLLRHLLSIRDREIERKAVQYLRERQGTDGSWNLYASGAGDLEPSLFPAVRRSSHRWSSRAVSRSRNCGTPAVLGIRLDGLDHQIEFVGAVDFSRYAVSHTGLDELGLCKVIEPVNAPGVVILEQEHRAGTIFRPRE